MSSTKTVHVAPAPKQAMSPHLKFAAKNEFLIQLLVLALVYVLGAYNICDRFFVAPNAAVLSF